MSKVLNSNDDDVSSFLSDNRKINGPVATRNFRCRDIYKDKRAGGAYEIFELYMYRNVKSITRGSYIILFNNTWLISSMV